MQAIQDTGLEFTAIDGSAEMAAEARKRTGHQVTVMRFEDQAFDRSFDGIEASASLLHVPRARLPDVLRGVHAALKPGGWSSLELETGRGKGYDGTENGWVEVLARKSADAG